MGQSEQENITSCEEYGQCWELENSLEQLEQRACHEKEKQQHEKWFRIQKNWALPLVPPDSWAALSKSLDLSKVPCSPLSRRIIIIKWDPLCTNNLQLNIPSIVNFIIVVVTRLSLFQNVRALIAWQGEEIESDGTFWSRKTIRGEWCCGRFILTQCTEKMGTGRECSEENHLGHLSRQTAWMDERGQSRGSWREALPHHSPQAAAATVDA